MGGFTRMWSIEFATADDAKGILAVQRTAFSENQSHYRFPLPAMVEGVEHIDQEIARDVVLVARQGSEVIGSVRFDVRGDECETYYLAVSPAYSNLAVGRALISRAEAEALSRGAKRMTAKPGLLDAAAIEFYMKIGYRPVQLITDPQREYEQVELEKRMVD